jgi:biopolymer transport protein ExbB/TolQ
MWFIEKFNEGGIFMYAILFFGILSLAFIVERYVALYRKITDPSMDFRNQLLNFVARGDLNGATGIAAAQSSTGIGRIAQVGVELRANHAADEEVQARMDEALSHEIHKVDQRTGFLAMFGNVATLLGLLGTISGMIGSFAAVASASPADRATMLSAGISEAMNCTAFGLIVAIPALVAYAVYQNRTDRYVSKLTQVTTAIFNDLLFLSDRDSGAPRFVTSTKNGKTSAPSASPN